MHKYDWNLQTFQSIDWSSHDKSIHTTRYSQKRFIIRFIHYRLPDGKMNFTSAHRCPYCDITQNQNTDHDHFLQCNSLRNEKKKWIETLRTALSKSFTPPNLRDAILDRVHNYYESNLREINKVDFEENHSYDSRSDYDERTLNQQGKRRVIDQDSIPSSADAASTSDPSNASNQSKPRRKLILRRDTTSSESEEEYFDLASIALKENSTQLVIEPLH